MSGYLLKQLTSLSIDYTNMFQVSGRQMASSRFTYRQDQSESQQMTSLYIVRVLYTTLCKNKDRLISELSNAFSLDVLLLAVLAAGCPSYCPAIAVSVKEPLSPDCTHRATTA
jgi:hypothetical protein